MGTGSTPHAMIEDIRNRMLAHFLEKAGFGAVSTDALDLLALVFEDRLTAFLNTISSRSAHALRRGTTLLDIMEYVENARAFTYRADPRSSSPLQSLEERRKMAAKRQSMFALMKIPPMPYEVEEYVPPKEWTSPLSTRVENFIHIYEFMPPFPPIHTFRLTSVKPSAAKNLSHKVKHRLEQSLKSEDNMIKLIKSSNSLPGFINYLYKGK